jgi:hypothetical protein
VTELQAPAHARRMLSALPGELKPGDQIQDHGRTRTISSIEANPGSPILAAVLHFDDGDDGLGLAPGIRVTTWRAADH